MIQARTFATEEMRGTAETPGEALPLVANGIDDQGQTWRRDGGADVRHRNAELEHSVRDRTLELEIVRRELDAFASSVSHDLRAPLRSIDGYARLLEEDCAGLDEHSRDYVRRIQANAERMGELIDGLLALSRISRSEIEPSIVDLSAMAREIIGDLRQRHPDHRVETEIADDLLTVGDERLLRTVLEQLFANAWQHTATNERATVAFTKEVRDSKVVLVVRDNGVGFDGEDTEKLFRPFVGSRNDERKGSTGIGLATVDRIVRRHGGHVWAEPVAEGGAAFFFTLNGKPEPRD